MKKGETQKITMCNRYCRPEYDEHSEECIKSVEGVTEEQKLSREDRLRGLFLILLCLSSANSDWLDDLESLLEGAIEHMLERKKNNWRKGEKTR